jgi:hypothetical protein
MYRLAVASTLLFLNLRISTLPAIVKFDTFLIEIYGKHDDEMYNAIIIADIVFSFFSSFFLVYFLYLPVKVMPGPRLPFFLVILLNGT